MTFRTLLVAVFALGAVTAAAPAQARPHRNGPQVADKGDRANKRERVKQRIRIMRALVLTEQLDLDEAAAGKMLPILDRYDDELAKLLAERAALRTRLDQARKAGKANDITAALDQLVSNQRARWTAEEQRFADLRGLLTPEQAARLLDLLPEVDRKILRGLRGAVDGPDDGARRGPRLRGGELGGNPFDTRK